MESSVANAGFSWPDNADQVDVFAPSRRLLHDRWARCHGRNFVALTRFSFVRRRRRRRSFYAPPPSPVWAARSSLSFLASQNPLQESLEPWLCQLVSRWLGAVHAFAIGAFLFSDSGDGTKKRSDGRRGAAAKHLLNARLSRLHFICGVFA